MRVFLDHVLAETKGFKSAAIGNKKFKREDLRDIPLVTIDGADARDFDDAVFAEKTNEGFSSNRRHCRCGTLCA